jgi:nitrate reductase NapE
MRRQPGDNVAEPLPPDAPSTRQEELRTFLFLTVVTAPVLAATVVVGWGFVVWMYQLFTGNLPGGG